MTSKTARFRAYDIDRAKGLAIFLVVLGHLVARGEPPEGADWYLFIKSYIYMFHMPFFMFLSGAVFGLSYKEMYDLDAYKRFAYKKIKRLLPPFIIFGTVIFLGKIIASSFMHVDDVQYSAVNFFIDILIFPEKSSAGSLWYIYVLLELYMLAPLLYFVTRNNMHVLLAASLILHFFPVTSYFMVDRLVEYSLYFFLGVGAVKNYDLYTHVIKKYFIYFFITFMASFFIVGIFPDDVSKLIIGLCSIPALHGLVLQSYVEKNKILFSLGRYTLIIYLMNTIMIGVSKGLLLMLIPWNGNNFFIFFVVLLFSGIVLPILFKKYIFPSIPYVDKISN